MALDHSFWISLLTSALVTTAGLTTTGCGRDAALPEAEAEAAQPEPPGGTPDITLTCEDIHPVDSQIEVLGTPTAGGLLDVRVRWVDRNVPWDCCPYQPDPAVNVTGPARIERQVVSSDDEGPRIDLTLAIEPGAAAEWIEMSLFADCAGSTVYELEVAPDPLAPTRAALAECVVVGDGFSPDRNDEAELRVSHFAIEGDVVPGGEVTVHLALAEVSGIGHGIYPGIYLSTAAGLIEVPSTAGQLYAITGCDEVPMSVPLTLPADLPVDAAIELTAFAGAPLCGSGDCDVHDTHQLTRRVLPPR